MNGVVDRVVRRSASLVAVLVLSGVACGRVGIDPALGDGPPATVSGLHATMDGLQDLPDAALLARLGQVGFSGLAAAEVMAINDNQRQALSYLARCALPPGVTSEYSPVKGGTFVVEGALGLAPEMETGTCEAGCQEVVTACLLAHVNAGQTTVPIWLTSGAPVVGRGTSPSYPIEEATFFGNLWTAGRTAAHCVAPTASDDIVPGRVGVRPGDGRGYEDLFSDQYHRNADELRPGTCAACTRAPDGGVEACALDGVTFAHPVTVWRSRTYQAEEATLSGSARIMEEAGPVLLKRVGYLKPGAAVTFEGVLAARAGSNRLAIYYMNGDPVGAAERKLAIAINGGPAHLEIFGPRGSNWDQAHVRLVTSDEFRAGTNTITLTAPSDGSGPDLDWIEVVP